MIIGIHGKKQSGKDVVGKIIQYLTSKDYETYKEVIKDRNLAFDYFIKDKYPLMGITWEIKKWAYKVKQITSIVLGEPDFIEKWEGVHHPLSSERGGVVKLSHEIFSVGYTTVEVSTLIVESKLANVVEGEALQDVLQI